MITIEKDLNEFSLIRLPRKDGDIHLYFTGGIDLYAIPKVSAELLDILKAWQPGDRVIIHFEKIVISYPDGSEVYSSGATYCDESCVALMVRIWKELVKRGGKVVLVISEPEVRKTFEIKSLTSIIKIVKDVSEIDDG